MPITPETDIADRGWSVEVSGSAHRVHGGVTLRETIEIRGPLSTLPAVEESGLPNVEGYQLRAVAAYDYGSMYYLMRVFELTAPEHQEVTGVHTRAIGPLRVLRWALPRTFEVDEGLLSQPVVDFVAPELKAHRLRSHPESRKKIELADVGTVCRLATIVRYPPSRALSEVYGFQPRTSTNWILRARTAGLA